MKTSSLSAANGMQYISDNPVYESGVHEGHVTLTTTWEIRLSHQPSQKLLTRPDGYAVP